MRTGRPFNFLAVCRVVRKYRRQMALSVGTKSTLVPLARRDEHGKLPANLFLLVTK
jgi:hypothetical protein